ncbi:MAG: M23 family metallopeptidase [Armatimonadetes bacterium]|nr:M23 family metallopeptidase [Armatimonadota bacterium]
MAIKTLFLLSLIAGPGIPRPDPGREAWGPAPPVAPFGFNPLPSDHVVLPMIFPVIGAVRFKDGYGERRANLLHTGIDILAPKMSPIVAPISGVIGFKMNPCSFWIYGDDGFAVLGTHLNDDNPGTKDHAGNRDVAFAPGLRPFRRVERGQFIGYVGTSGDATSPHMHFEIYAPGNGRTQERLRNPMPSLAAATKISTPISYPLFDAKLAPGAVRYEGYPRSFDPATDELTLLLSYCQHSGGVGQAITRTEWRKFKLSKEQIAALGGVDSVGRIPQFRAVSIVESAEAIQAIEVDNGIHFGKQ